MSIDIREGDTLVVGTDEYPIRSAAFYAAGLKFTRSFRKRATVTADTKRPPALSGGVRGVAALNLENLKITPLDPADPEIRQRLDLDTPHEILQTFYANSTGYVHLILEDLKR